ncbi:acyltransferase [Hymenobacter glaciei]
MVSYSWRKWQGVNVLSHPKTRIKGLRNISTDGGVLNLLLSCGAIDGTEPTSLDVQGKMQINGDVAIGRGCRVDIGPDATVDIGDGTYINPRSQFVIKHGLRIGQHCAISWECQFLDEDFHTLSYKGQRPSGPPEIVVGDRVWIGNRVSVYKGVVIPNGCVVASNSVVKHAFTEENVLLAGNPAQIVRRNVKW